MEKLEIMRSRHSVRQYIDRPIEADKREILDILVKNLNEESGMNIQIIYDEPKCFSSFMAKYGKFTGCSNYISLVGKKGEDLDEKAGYYGEAVVMMAQGLGLNTCWAAMTHGKTKAVVGPGEKEAIVIALGYGKTQGVPHKDKKLSDVCDLSWDREAFVRSLDEGGPDLDACDEDGIPRWFKLGMEAVMLAPTAVNQQKFKYTLTGDGVKAVSLGGICSKIDLGITKYHFDAVTRIKLL